MLRQCMRSPFCTYFHMETALIIWSISCLYHIWTVQFGTCEISQVLHFNNRSMFDYESEVSDSVWHAHRNRGVYELQPVRAPPLPQSQVDARYRAPHEVNLPIYDSLSTWYILVWATTSAYQICTHSGFTMQHYGDPSMDVTVQAVRQKLDKVCYPLYTHCFCACLETRK